MLELLTGALVAERFAIDELAARGGMACVYRARDLLSGEPVALKIQPPADSGALQRFEREARLLAELRHPGVVRYVANGLLADGELWLAMEWLQGEPLSSRLARGRLGAAELLALGAAIADILVELHARGVVHRDLKPGNIFLAGAGPAVKLLDFGIAGLRRASASITRAGSILGTPGYMAPEQARGGDCDGRADLFALGCVLYECASGAPPFVGEDCLAVLAKIVLEEAPSLSQVAPGTPREISLLVESLLQKDPARRPAGASALLEELRALVAELPADSSPAAPPEPARPALTPAEQRFLTVALIEPLAQVARAGGTLRVGEASTAHGAPIAPADAVEAHKGRLTELADGALVATWSGTDAGDQAASAARCALALRGLAPSARIAIATGRGVALFRSWSGEAIDRAARRLRAASGEPALLIDEVTASLLGPRFELRGPAAGLELVREREAPVRRTLLGKPTPCVGRERELQRLVAGYAECADEPVACATLLVAPPGVGKSRLVAEMVDALRARPDAPRLFLGSGDAMRAGSPFSLLRSLLRNAFGVRAGEPAGERAAKIGSRLARLLAPVDAERVAAFLGDLLGAAAGGALLAAARGDPQLMGDQRRRAFEEWLAAECAAGPVVLVLEDLHWGDLPTVKFVDLALRNLADRPLFVVGVGRPEVHEAFPRLWAERRVEELRLLPLTPKASARLVRVALGEHAEDAAIERIVQLGAGNALHLEELIRAAADGCEAPPQTVLAMLHARLSRLDPEGRQVLRAASIFGQRFWTGGVEALLGGQVPKERVREWLLALADEEVVAAGDGSRFPGEEQHSFRHALVGDACYATLTEADRALGHRLARDWLQARGEADALVLAEHCERGGEPERGGGYWHRAAEQALEGDDVEAALSRARRALGCAVGGDSRGALLMLCAEAHLWRGEYAQAAQCAGESLALLPEGGQAWLSAAGLLAEARGKHGDQPQLLELGRALLAQGGGGELAAPHAVACVRTAAQLFLAGQGAAATALIDRAERARSALAAEPRSLAFVEHGRSVRALFGGDLGAYRELKASAADLFEHAGDRRNACSQRAKLGYANLMLGAYAEAEVELREALALAERHGLHQIRAGAWHNLGLALVLQNKVEEARRFEELAIAAFAEQGDTRLLNASRCYLAQILLRAGDVDGAAREAARAVADARSGSPGHLHALAHLAQVRLAERHLESALGSAREAARLLDEVGGTDEGESLVRLMLVETLWATGARDDARAALGLARERLQRRAALIAEPRWRESFLARVPENARTFAVDQEWRLG